MTPEILKRLNEGVAWHLGWRNIETDGFHRTWGARPVGNNAYVCDNLVPDYFSDDLPIRTRGEMLAVLSIDQKIELVRKARFPVGPNEGWLIADAINVLELKQSDFATLFCRVVGIEGKEVK